MRWERLRRPRRRGEKSFVSRRGGYGGGVRAEGMFFLKNKVVMLVVGGRSCGDWVWGQMIF